MRHSRESKEEKFQRLAEARVNKILHLYQLLGNLSWTGTYAYTRDQVDQIFTVLQAELIRAKLRFQRAQATAKKRFSLSGACNPYASEISEANPMLQFRCLTALTFGQWGILPTHTHVSTSTGTIAAMHRMRLFALWNSILSMKKMNVFALVPTAAIRMTPLIMRRT